MSIDTLVAAAIGAFFGSLGWLLVGMWLQRRQAERQARSAARAVYFELAMNSIDIEVAAQHLVFQPLRRGSFDRLLPELATWLHADELELIVKAYMTHAGYEQAQRDEALPAPVRMAVIRRVLEEHRSACNLLRGRAFTAKEASRLSSATAPAGAPNA
jgi:hypothetical protein